MSNKGLPRITPIDDTWLISDDDEAQPLYRTERDVTDLEELIRLMERNSMGMRWERFKLNVSEGVRGHWKMTLFLTSYTVALMALMFMASAYGAGRIG